MHAKPPDDPVLVRLRNGLKEAYGPDSDYDVAVFIKNPGEPWDELDILAHITTDILHETGTVMVGTSPATTKGALSPPVLIGSDPHSCWRYAVTDASYDAGSWVLSGKARRCLADAVLY